MAGILNELQGYLQNGPFEPDLEQIARDISAISDKEDQQPDASASGDQQASKRKKD